jgi:hypothetical protein
LKLFLEFGIINFKVTNRSFCIVTEDTKVRRRKKFWNRYKWIQYKCLLYTLKKIVKWQKLKVIKIELQRLQVAIIPLRIIRKVQSGSIQTPFWDKLTIILFYRLWGVWFSKSYSPTVIYICLVTHTSLHKLFLFFLCIVQCEILFNTKLFNNLFLL